MYQKDKKNQALLLFIAQIYIYFFSQPYVRMVICHMWEGTAPWEEEGSNFAMKEDMWGHSSSMCFQHFVKYFIVHVFRKGNLSLPHLLLNHLDFMKWKNACEILAKKLWICNNANNIIIKNSENSNGSNNNINYYCCYYTKLFLNHILGNSCYLKIKKRLCAI